MNKTNYTPPVLCTSNPKDWYIYFSFTHQGKKHDLKRREDLNRFKGKDRRKFGEALCEARNEWLQSGWNPITDPKFLLRNAEGLDNGVQKMTLPKALDFALSQMKNAPKTLAGYKSTLGFLKLAIIEVGLTDLPISSLKRFHVKMIMAKASKRDGGLSNHAVNKYKDTFRRLCTELMEWEVLEYNPASKIANLEVAESNKFASWTNEEKLAVQKFLYLNHYRFYVYLMVLYHTGIRPKEILALKIKDANLNDQTFTLVPDLTKQTTKTKTIRKVAIDNELLPFLRELKLDHYPGEYYIFGSPFAHGTGNRGTGSQTGGIKGAKRENYFFPSSVQIKRDTVTKLFNALIRDEKTGLKIDGNKIDKYMYALKHTGADDKILAGISLDALQAQYGHESKLMTAKYTKRVKDIYRDELVNKAPAFTKN